MYLDWIKKKNTPVFYWFRSKEEAKFWKKGMRAYFEPYNFRKEGENSWRLQGRCAVYSALAKIASLPEDHKQGSLDMRVGSETKSFKFDSSVLRHPTRVKSGHAVFLNIGTEETKEFSFGILDIWPLGKGIFQQDGLVTDSESKVDLLCGYNTALGGIRLLPNDHVEYLLEQDKPDDTPSAINVRLCGPLIGTVKDRASASRALYRVAIHPDQRQMLVLFSNQTVTPKQDIEFSMFWDFTMEEYVAKDVKKVAALPPVPRSQLAASSSSMSSVSSSVPAQTSSQRPQLDSSSEAVPSSPPAPLSPQIGLASSNSSIGSLRSSSGSIGAAIQRPSSASAPSAPVAAPLLSISPPKLSALHETAKPILTQLISKILPAGAARISEILLESHASDEQVLRLIQDPHYLTIQATEAMKVYEAELRRQISAAEILVSSHRSPSVPNLFSVSSFPPAMQSIAAQMLAQQAAQAGMSPEVYVNLMIHNMSQQQQQQQQQPPQGHSPRNGAPLMMGGLTAPSPQFSQAGGHGMMQGLFGLPTPSFSPLMFQPASPTPAEDVPPVAEAPLKIDNELSFFPHKILHKSCISTTYEGLRTIKKLSTQRVCVRVYDSALIEEDAVPEMVSFAQKRPHAGLPTFVSSAVNIGKSLAVAMQLYPTTLREYLAGNSELPKETRRNLALQLLSVVEHLHANEVVCRDINLDCIFVQEDRHVCSWSPSAPLTLNIVLG